MTDTYKGHDLTTMLEQVAEARYERDRRDLFQRSGGKTDLIPWDKVTTFAKQQIKSALLPVVTDVLDAIQTTVEIGVRDNFTPEGVADQVTDGFRTLQDAADWADPNVGNPNPGDWTVVTRAVTPWVPADLPKETA